LPFKVTVVVLSQSDENYLFLHEKFIHPEEILRRKDIFLYYFDKTHVAFGVVAPGDDIYHTEKYPFQIIYNIKAVQ